MSDKPAGKKQTPSEGDVQLTLRDASGQLLGTGGATAEGIFSFDGWMGGLTPPTAAGALAGSVFLDVDGDGRRGPGEPGYAGITVLLTGTESSGKAIRRHAVTDNEGRYRFDELQAGYYRLELSSAIPNTQPGQNHIGNLGGQTQGAALVCSLQAGQVGEHYDFARVLPPSDDLGEDPHAAPITPRDLFFSALAEDALQPSALEGLSFAAAAVEVPAAEALSTLSGYVFHDRDADGEQGEGDRGLPGIVVTLKGITTRGKPVVFTSTTDEDGAFAVAEIPPGTYSLSRQVPSAYTSGRPIPGTVNGTPTGQVQGETIRAIVLSGAAFGQNYRFAEVRSATLTGMIQLEDDLDEDGPLEMPLAGIHVLLSGTDRRGLLVQLTATTDERGLYRFVGLYPGHYELYPAPPRGLGLREAKPGDKGGRVAGAGKLTGIPLESGDTATRYNFTLQGNGSLAGRVVSFGPSGRLPLVGVAITLTGRDDWGNDLLRRVRTDEHGLYRFVQLRTGYYRIEAEVPGNPQRWNAIVGTGGGEAEPGGDRPPAIDAIPLAAGVAQNGYDFLSGESE
jgi:protocatechuate 3,4-dioxygenase beta subunit